MANNRMYLVFAPTGDRVYLGKRMLDGWYDVPTDLSERVGKLFNIASDHPPPGNGESVGDDFSLGMEDTDWARDDVMKINPGDRESVK